MNRYTLIIFFLVLISGCVSVKQTALYDIPDNDITPHIHNFYATKIFTNQISNDVWFTVAPLCLNVNAENTVTKSGNGAIHLEWNKQAGDCPWLGMGIGWDNWVGKNFESITNDAALSFWAKSKQGELKGLPWAVGFEDFSGGQAWTGVTTEYVVGGIVKEDWTQIIIPLNRFPFESFDVDITAIKQIIFQFESSGKVWIDEISLIPFVSNDRKEINLISSKAPLVDGVINTEEWPQEAFELSSGKIKLNWDATNVYVSAIVEDDSPMINNRNASEIWNGDAIEFAFSTLAGVDVKRKIYYDSDHHIGIKIGTTTEVYSWSQGKVIDEAVVKTTRVAKGYQMEAAIPWSALNATAWKEGMAYGVEWAIDIANASGVRTVQNRWNSFSNEGFNFNPSLWGSVTIKTQEQ